MDNEANFDDFQKKFRVAELLVLKSDYWSWSVRPNQPTLGAGILSLNRPALTFSEVTRLEMADLSDMVSAIESKIGAVFKHNIMNYLMLMMVDHHVHYHVIPRYDGSRKFFGLEWLDNGWAGLPVLTDNQHHTEKDIVSEIQKALI